MVKLPNETNFPVAKFYKLCYQISDLIVSKAAKTVLNFTISIKFECQNLKKTHSKGRLRVNPHMPVAHKVADEVVFRRLQGGGVEFLNRTFLTSTSPSDF